MFQGITCLFIASKVEEIYPPKLTEFAYVTDGACQTEQILDKELVILKTLNWNLSSVTVHGWLNLFAQLCNRPTNDENSLSNHSFVFPNHSIREYLQCAQLVDLSTLDEGSLRFSYSVLAASSIYLTSYKDQILGASGEYEFPGRLYNYPRSLIFLLFFGFHSFIFFLPFNRHPG